MAKNLVIVESPAKAKKIGKFLGKDYVVKASIGHVRDLPEKRLGVKVEENFRPEYVPTERGKKVLQELRKEAKKCDRIFLAPDPDREGEAIAWHLFEELRSVVPEDRFYRVTYNEITPSAIRAAFANPGKIDMNRVNAQQARRILDRLVGFKGSKVVRRQIRDAESVGRVQTVALRLVVEREKAIENFKPEPYYLVAAEAQKREGDYPAFTARLVRVGDLSVGVKERKVLPGTPRTEEEVEALRRELGSAPVTVASITERETVRRPKAPFITSTLQQAASGSLGFSPARTMALAQKLYENGLITYMRTDSVNIAAEARETCREYIRERFGPEYIPERPNHYKSKGSAQEAHEAIRPTDVALEPEKALDLDPAERKLYRLIRDRFIACQMAPARIRRRTVELSAGEGGRCLFRVSASEVIFPGFMKVAGVEAAGNGNGGVNGEEGEPEVDTLPPLQEGEEVDVRRWITERKETRPLPRYTEAALIRALEENGVGRPSTYAAIMSKLYERGYVKKEKRALVPTELGRKLIDLVVRTEQKLRSENKVDLFEVNFTADMEERLDRIEEGKVEWTEMMRRFYPSLLEWIEHARETADPDLVRDCIEALGHVKEWAPPSKSGRRTFDDRKTFEDLRARVEAGEKLSRRQGEMLRRMCARYLDQIPAELVERLGLKAEEEQAPEREETRRKLDLLLSGNIKFDPPRKSGRRTYDDEAFVRSLAEQVARGKRLSDRQVAALDRLVLKYAAQIENFEQLRESLGLPEAEKSASDEAVAELLEHFGRVTEWDAPVKRGKREYDDRAFYESLAEQFRAKGSLSDRQVAALKKMAARYADRIPGYDRLREKYNLPAPRRAAAKKESGKQTE